MKVINLALLCALLLAVLVSATITGNRFKPKKQGTVFNLEEQDSDEENLRDTVDPVEAMAEAYYNNLSAKRTHPGRLDFRHKRGGKREPEIVDFTHGRVPLV